ncbi:MAG: 5-formyltetrahydrofolate cyclo-ligase [Sporichthyaceae bacterium]
MSAQPQDRLDRAAVKAALRAELLARRRELSAEARTDADRAIGAAALAAPAIARATRVAAYISTGTEPGTRALLDALAARGADVVVPALQADGDLDWVRWSGHGDLLAGARGTVEPDGARLGLDALSLAEVILVPGLGVDRAGHRLGRGAGSYDRALRRAHPAALVAVVLYAHEILDSVPAEEHDIAVAAALTPRGLVGFSPRGS